MNSSTEDLQRELNRDLLKDNIYAHNLILKFVVVVAGCPSFA